MSDSEFIEIQPFEYQLMKGRYPRIVTYFGFKLSPALTQEVIENIIRDLQTQKKISVGTNPNGMLMWEYKGKPPIALNKTENKVYTTHEALNRFGMENCQEQAACVLQVIRKYGYAKFTQFVIRFQPHRFGRTKEERALTYEALERLARKKFSYPKLQLSPRLMGRQMHAERNYIYRRQMVGNE
jgi:hypothetical protein